MLSPGTANVQLDAALSPGTVNVQLDAALSPTPAAEPVISIRGLRKRYGDHEAVRGIDLEVRRGEIFAFLGPNGAGKTTTVEILEGFRQASDGQVRVLGVDPWQAPLGVARADRDRAAGVRGRAGPDRARVPRAVRRLLPRAALGRRDARARRAERAGRSACDRALGRAAPPPGRRRWR